MTTRAQLPPSGQRTPGVDYVGTRGAAAILGVTERTVARWADDGRIAVSWVTDGGHRRFLVRHLRAVACRTNPTGEPAHEPRP